ncbi:nucleotidyltransferase domain-containing protein [Agrococcus beijingensis]|uniref:nucleotidyltransferase domain-containing protein n=1 Tax=Agrococcus beijingensis TaxID=3068634 RepID=UPI0027410E11|nr:lincomycin resistance protein LmrB [Agrococcus sp. REN33]
MQGSEVARVVAWLEARGVVYQCNGGWAVDALVGRQTRPHADLDVFLDETAMADAVGWLERDGYRVAVDWLPVRVELRAGEGAASRAVDLHPMRIVPGGDGVQALLDGGSIVHPAASRAVGSVAGQRVVVADAARLISLREGYELRPVDSHDLALLRGLLA